MTDYSPMRILWIDEEGFGIRRYIDVLRFEQHIVETLADARSAVDQLHASHRDYDAIIVDVMLPSGDSTLFPPETTDDDVSTGIVLARLLIEGRPPHFKPLEEVQGRLLLFSGNSTPKIVEKLVRLVNEHKVHYLEKSSQLDAIGFARKLREFFRERRPVR